MKRQTETDLLRQCLELLKLHHLFAWRANAGSGLRMWKGKMRPVKSNPAGTPDILLVLPARVHNPHAPPLWLYVGRLVGVEAKMPGKERSPDQLAWAENAAKVGVPVWVVTDVKQLEAFLRAEGVMK